MVKHIIWSRLAHLDRFQIFEVTADLISKHPKIGKDTDIIGVRIKTIKDYFFTYRETETTIEILTIWDSRQDPSKFDRIMNKSGS